MECYRGNYTQVYLHMVWATWDRKPLLTPEVRAVVYPGLLAECARLRSVPIAIGGVADHVHLLVRLPTTVTVAELAKQLKGSTAHLVNHRRLTPGPFRWQGGYGVFSVSRGNVPAVKRYVLRQEDHHKRGALTPALEPPPR